MTPIGFGVHLLYGGRQTVDWRPWPVAPCRRRSSHSRRRLSRFAASGVALTSVVPWARRFRARRSTNFLRNSAERRTQFLPTSLKAPSENIRKSRFTSVASRPHRSPKSGMDYNATRRLGYLTEHQYAEFERKVRQIASEPTGPSAARAGAPRRPDGPSPRPAARRPLTPFFTVDYH